MRPVRVLCLAFALALCLFALDGGLVSSAAAETCPMGTTCRGDGDCFTYCCTTYGCDPSYPPFCSYFPGYETCGMCFC